MDKKELPNPGSSEAIKEGCSCPVLDNAHGRGVYRDSEGDMVYWLNGNCPVHSGNTEIGE